VAAAPDPSVDPSELTALRVELVRVQAELEGSRALVRVQAELEGSRALVRVQAELEGSRALVRCASGCGKGP
jgi:hypothetical protein